MSATCCELLTSHHIQPERQQNAAVSGGKEEEEEKKTTTKKQEAEIEIQVVGGRARSHDLLTGLAANFQFRWGLSEFRFGRCHVGTAKMIINSK